VSPTDGPKEPTVLSVTSIDSARKGPALRSRSYLSLVTVLERNLHNVLLDKQLELNEMTGRVEYGRKPIRDIDVGKIRAMIEHSIIERYDKDDRPVGLQFSQNEAAMACEQVAQNASYHPVREYFSKLKPWDRVERIGSVAEDILDAQGTALNRAILRRFFVSCVLRVLRPGCKVDTVLVLVGKQGAKKSTFFRELATPWHLDTAVDLQSKDAFEQLRGAWIFEWSELESLRRARDVAAAKAFLTSRVDHYRPSYGRYAIDVPRMCVIVGTTNNDEFLVDTTGNRRFWPIRTGDNINIDLLIENRDQLWAEALELALTGEQHWLDGGESELLEEEQKQYRATDPWDAAIVDWMEKLRADNELTTGDVITVTISQVLEEAIKKPKFQLMHGDTIRVAAILKEHGARRAPRSESTRYWLIPKTPIAR